MTLEEKNAANHPSKLVNKPVEEWDETAKSCLFVLGLFSDMIEAGTVTDDTSPVPGLLPSVFSDLLYTADSRKCYEILKTHGHKIRLSELFRAAEGMRTSISIGVGIMTNEARKVLEKMDAGGPAAGTEE